MDRLRAAFQPRAPAYDPRQADRTARLAALTQAHIGGSVAGSSQQSPVLPQPPSYPFPYPQPPSVAPAAAAPAAVSTIRARANFPTPNDNRARASFPTASEEKRQLEAELVSEAVCASLRATDPEEWRARAEASWRVQAATVETPSKVRKGERLMLEAQELSAMAEEWRLRAEEAWERHLLEGDEETMKEMKDAQRRAKKYESRMMDKLALLAVEEEEEEARRQEEAEFAASQPRPQPPAGEPTAEDRHQAALEQLARRRQAQDAANAQRRLQEQRRVHRANYTRTWDLLQSNTLLNLDFVAFPWPSTAPVRRPSDIDRRAVLDFVLDGAEDDARRRERVRAALKTWAPAGDRFAQRVLRHVEPASRDAVLEGHAMIVRILNGEVARLG